MASGYIYRKAFVFVSSIAVSFLTGICSTADISDAATINQSKQPVEFVQCVYGPVRDDVSEEDVKLMALVAIAEAEGECEEGKRLVIDTILNRVDSVYFPGSFRDVIYQENAFSSMWDGRANRVCITDDVIRLVREELIQRLNYEVMFFCADGYSIYGHPLFQVGNHYFSSY